MEHIHELLGYEKLKIVQNDEMFSFSLDSMLLADFIKTTSKTKKIIDLGSGNCPIPLFLTLKTNALIYAVEIQKDVYELGKKSIKLNNKNGQIILINDNIKNIYKSLGNDSFDIVSSNPPFFKLNEKSIINKNEYKTIARHEALITLEEIIIEAKKLLVDGGSFNMVHRTSRLPEIVNLFKKYNLGIRRIRFIYPKKEDNSSLMFLIEGRKNKKDDLVVESPLYIYEDNKYTKEILEIFNFKEK